MAMYSELKSEVDRNVEILKGVLGPLADRDGNGHKTEKTLSGALADVRKVLDSVDSYVDKDGTQYKHGDFNSFCAFYDKSSKDLIVADGYETKETESPAVEFYSGVSGKYFDPSGTGVSLSGTGFESVFVGASLIFRGFTIELTGVSASGKLCNVNSILCKSKLEAIAADVCGIQNAAQAVVDDIKAVNNDANANLSDIAAVAANTSGMSLYYF